MNVKNVLALADYIENGGWFSMNYGFSCIMGFCQRKFGGKASHHDVARELGISTDEAWKMCVQPEIRLGLIEREDAVAMLRNLAETGRVEYRIPFFKRLWRTLS